VGENVAMEGKEKVVRKRDGDLKSQEEEESQKGKTEKKALYKVL